MQPTPEQAAIIASQAKHLLVIAGAGTGKTTTLAAYLHAKAQELGRTDRMVVITFTNEAAAHLLLKLGSSFKPSFCGTLHAWALRQITAQLGTWTVLDDETAAEIMTEVIAAHCYTGSRVAVEAAKLSEDIGTTASVIAKAYRDKLLNKRCLDFDLILYKFRQLLRDTNGGSPLDVLAVDEYQDTAPIDAEIYATVNATHRFTVGDPDQCIYSFRGASLRNILSLAEDTEIFPLTSNWRSAPPIIDAANALISRNTRRIPKRLAPGRPDLSGAIATPPPYDSEIAEALHLAHMARAEAAKGLSVAILARTNADVATLAKALPEAKAAQPAPERRILLAALNALIDPTNATAAGPWIAHMIAANKRTAACIEASGKAPLAYLLSITKQSAAAPTIAHLRAMKVPQAAITWAIANGVQLARGPAMAREQTVAALRADDIPQGTGDISITTFHGAKGREWDHVFIAAAEQEATPGQKTGDELEEERRIFFVALTRARRFVTITSAKHRANAYKAGQHEPRTPTRFIAELCPA